MPASNREFDASLLLEPLDRKEADGSVVFRTRSIKVYCRSKHLSRGFETTLRYVVFFTLYITPPIIWG